MALAYNFYVGDGSTTAFLFTQDITEGATVLGLINYANALGTWDLGTMTFTFDVAPAVGVNINITRLTNSDEALALYPNKSYISSENLDLDFQQLIHLIQEGQFTDQFIAATGGTDAVGYATEWANNPKDVLISNGAGGDQIDDYSALHFAKYAEGSAATAVIASAGASSSKLAAATSATNAATSETNASNFESAAGLSATAAGNSETAAALSETNAGNSETAAGVSETNAAASLANALIAEGITVTNVGVTNAAALAALNSETAAGISEDNALVSELAAAVSASNALAAEVVRPNLIINGGMQIWQRGSLHTAASNTQYTADRWRNVNSGGTSVNTVQRVTSSLVPGYRNANVVERLVTTADPVLTGSVTSGLQYPIEGYSFSALRGPTFTLSFDVKSSVPGVHCLTFRNSNTDRSYVAEYTVNTADVWQHIAVTVPLDTSGTWMYNSQLGMYITFVSAATGTATPGTWAAGNFVSTTNQVNGNATVGNHFLIGNVKLENGSVASQFELPQYGTTLIECKRYFEVLSMIQGTEITAGTSQAQRSWLVQKRTTPVVATTAGTATWTNIGTTGIRATLNAPFGGNTITGNAEFG